jgi:hypothetical protein
LPFVLGAVLLALGCVGVAWRALRRCASIPDDELDPSDGLELQILQRERNLHLNLAGRNVQVLGRVALFGGTGLGIATLTGGRQYDMAAGAAFFSGVLGWTICAEFRRRIGSLAESWRVATNRKRRRQGVDPSERTS